MTVTTTTGARSFATVALLGFSLCYFASSSSSSLVGVVQSVSSFETATCAGGTNTSSCICTTIDTASSHFLASRNPFSGSSSSSSSSSSSTSLSSSSVCGLYFAPSTIPEAGFGLFAGQGFEKGQEVTPGGDLVVPLIDLMWHYGYDRFADDLWEDYRWSAKT
jgi:hypothetical protein